MKEQELLKKICDLILGSDIRSSKTPLEWMSHILTLHQKRWLYCSMKGKQLVAVGCAFRIPSWDDKYLDQFPEKEEGNILFVPFVAANDQINISLLRLLRFCLRENPGVKEIIYFRKNKNTKKYVFRVNPEQLLPKSRKKVEILPPEKRIAKKARKPLLIG